MRKAICVLSLAFTLASVGRADPSTEDYSRLLAKYVTPHGVRYAAWHADAADRAALEKVVSAMAAQKPMGSRDEKLAFYINAYNANILQGVLEKYPLKSVRDIAPLFGFFTQNRITVAGEKMSFNHLEKDIIHGFGEPRMHFVLNCASASCPPLLAKAYTAGQLDEEMDQQTTAFLNRNPMGARITDAGQKAEVSKIFEWDAGDFQAAGGVAGFINKYRKPPLPAGAQITYQNYDWSLNAAD
jgi:hypothetical protein